MAHERDQEQDCIFCRIAAGEFDTEFVYESDTVVAFDDLAPQAETHVLVIPRRHIASIAAVDRGHDSLLGELVAAATSVASDRKLNDSGYRLLTNHGPDAGQTVMHLHLHLLGGNALGPLG
ncbi:MAG: histidine triad nucleotide-binding protein [Chloroflexota bacterium]|nr:histidine triad nucleotide-binding protein [Chloroflexota bacterium]